MDMDTAIVEDGNVVSLGVGFGVTRIVGPDVLIFVEEKVEVCICLAVRDRCISTLFRSC